MLRLMKLLVFDDRVRPLACTLGLLSGLYALAWWCFLPVADPQLTQGTHAPLKVVAVSSPNAGPDNGPMGYRARQALWARVETRLEMDFEAEKQDVRKAIDSIDAFFEARRPGVQPFVSDMLSYWGKLQHVKGVLDPDAHQRFLQECFDRHLFSARDLEKALESATVQVLSKVEERENLLLVEIQADLELSDPRSQRPSLHPDKAALRKQYQSLLERVAPELSRDLGVEITKQMLDWTVMSPLIAKIAADLAARLGISGAVLGTGAASGTVSFGISVVTGILIDRLLTWAFRLAGHDPEAKIAAQIEKSIEQISSIVITGYWQERPPGFWEMALESVSQIDGATSSKPEPSDEILGNQDKRGGFIDHIYDVLDLRAELREAALKRLILEGGDQ